MKNPLRPPGIHLGAACCACNDDDDPVVVASELEITPNWFSSIIQLSLK